jgi:hypothetical protein
MGSDFCYTLFMHTHTMSNKAIWVGRIMGGIATLFLTFDSITHLLKLSFVTKAMADMGLDPNLAFTIGAILFVSLVLYVIPRTAFFGALLLTAYLGGAVATNLLFGLPFFNILFAMIIGVFVWAGLYVTNPCLRTLVKEKINAKV